MNKNILKLIILSDVAIDEKVNAIYDSFQEQLTSLKNQHANELHIRCQEEYRKGYAQCEYHNDDSW